MAETITGNILLVEDDKELSCHIATYLREMSLAVTICGEGHSALAFATNNHYDLILLDLMLPGLNGLDICHSIRRTNVSVPIMMITALDTEADRIVGLDQGADDYIVKPFSIRELQARVRAQLRRGKHLKTAEKSNLDHGKKNRRLNFGPLQVDIISRRVILKEQPLSLTAKEFELLTHFMQHPGQVFSRAQLLDIVWGYGFNGYQHTVNSHINRLRMKVESNPANPTFILTVWGVGYKFTETCTASN